MKNWMLGSAVVLGLGLTGCGDYGHVTQGWQGATSPAESGQQGANANQDATASVMPEKKGPAMPDEKGVYPKAPGEEGR